MPAGYKTLNTITERKRGNISHDEAKNTDAFLSFPRLSLFFPRVILKKTKRTETQTKITKKQEKHDGKTNDSRQQR